MTKEELKSLTIEQIEEMSQAQIDAVADEVLAKLDESDIEELSSEVMKKLNIEREGCFGGLSTWIALILSSLVGTIVAAALGG